MVDLQDQIQAALATISKHEHRIAQHRASTNPDRDKHVISCEIRIAEIHAWIAESRRLGHPAPSAHLIPAAAPAASTGLIEAQ